MTEKLKRKSVKTQKPGIIYFSRIPPKMTVRTIRQILGTYGEIGKVFLQPDEKSDRKDKRRRNFTEGWVEFLDKKIAKDVAIALNGQAIKGKRKSPWYDDLWTMKYLPRFRWTNLTERLEYERMTRRQRLNIEIRHAKKEVEFYKSSVEHKTFQDRIKNRKAKTSKFSQKLAHEFDPCAGSNLAVAAPSSGTAAAAATSSDVHDVNVAADRVDRDWRFSQRLTDQQVTDAKGSRKRKHTSAEKLREAKKLKADAVNKSTVAKTAAENPTFLKSLFSGGLKHSEDN